VSGELHHVVAGEGSLLVLVHGSWSDHHAWDVAVPELARSWRVVAYDRRGYGRSAPWRTPRSVGGDVADLAALIEGIGGPAFVVGGSFGGSIALALAATRPELVRGVAAHEPPALDLLPAADTAALRAQAAAVMQVIERGDREAAARLFYQTIAPGAPVTAAIVGHAESWLAEARDPSALVIDLEALGRWRGPTLLTGGALSPPFFGAILDVVAGAAPHARRELVPGTAHLPQGSPRWRAVLRRWLEDARG
jgi:pimeloyl-ACP methyl ester carboxylesterase